MNEPENQNKKAAQPETRTKQAKDLRAGDVILSGGESFEVRRVHGPTRKDWNHATVYFRSGGATTVIATTEFKLETRETYTTSDQHDNDAWANAQLAGFGSPKEHDEATLAASAPDTAHDDKTADLLDEYYGETSAPEAPTLEDHIRDLHDAATRFEDRARRAEQERDELLAALKDIYSAPVGTTQHELATIARLAIAKAEGRAE
jgi:hypothetical protein